MLIADEEERHGSGARMTADGSADVKDRDLLDILETFEHLLADGYGVLQTIRMRNIA